MILKDSAHLGPFHGLAFSAKALDWLHLEMERFIHDFSALL
jgi:hypothetical protein